MPRPKLTKVCQSCKVDKVLDEYNNNLTKPDGRNGICKKCQARVDKERRNGLKSS